MMCAQVVLANVRTDNATGAVSSKCGTHLGSFLPDDKGPSSTATILGCF